jgi:hypothetical protein
MLDKDEPRTPKNLGNMMLIVEKGTKRKIGELLSNIITTIMTQGWPIEPFITRGTKQNVSLKLQRPIKYDITKT